MKERVGDEKLIIISAAVRGITVVLAVCRSTRPDLLRHGLLAKRGLESQLHLVDRFAVFRVNMSSVVLCVRPQHRPAAVVIVRRLCFQWVAL